MKTHVWIEFVDHFGRCDDVSRLHRSAYLHPALDGVEVDARG